MFCCLLHAYTVTKITPCGVHMTLFLDLETELLFQGTVFIACMEDVWLARR